MEENKGKSSKLHLFSPIATAVPGTRYTQTHTHAHTHMQQHRSWLSQRERLEARMLYLGCLAFAGCLLRYLRNTTQQQIRKKMEIGSITARGFPWACLSLAGRNSSPYLFARFRDFEGLEHSPRSPAGATLAPYGPRRPPAGPAARSTRKDPRPNEKNELFRKKSQFYTKKPLYIYSYQVPYEPKYRAGALYFIAPPPRSRPLPRRALF